MAQKRKLTRAEIKRTGRFRERAETLEREGYERTDLTVAINTASLLSFLVMLPFVLIIAVPYLRQYGIGSIGSIWMYLLNLALFIILMIFELAGHEAIHGLVWGLINKDGFGTIEFGLIREYLTPYCCCGSPLLRRQYILGSVMPAIILGFIQGWIVIRTGSFLLFCLFLSSSFLSGNAITVSP